MKEKIFAALKTKFVGVDDAILNRIAEKKAVGVTDESQVNSIVEGISFPDVLISYGDFRANTAVTSAVANYEKKHGLKDGKPIEEPNHPINQPTPPVDQPSDIAKIIADAVSAAVTPLKDQLNSYEQKGKAEQRLADVLAKGKEYGIPEFILKGRQIADDADLDAVCKDLKQEMTNSGFQGIQPPENPEQTIKTDSENLAKMINDGTQELIKK